MTTPQDFGVEPIQINGEESENGFIQNSQVKAENDQINQIINQNQTSVTTSSKDRRMKILQEIKRTGIVRPQYNKDRND